MGVYKVNTTTSPNNRQTWGAGLSHVGVHEVNKWGAYIKR